MSLSLKEPTDGLVYYETLSANESWMESPQVDAPTSLIATSLRHVFKLFAPSNVDRLNNMQQQESRRTLLTLAPPSMMLFRQPNPLLGNDDVSLLSEMTPHYYGCIL